MRWEEGTFDDLCRVLFASLPRSDQRRRGVEYLRGLLGVRGRRSIRNIAAPLGGSAIEQSLHHFVCSSTWDWVPVRQALAGHLVRQAPPLAWVVQPMAILKAGGNSVGVDRQYVPEAGRVLNAQHAVGVWAATEEVSGPVNWRMYLSSSWLDDRSRRRRASIPDHVREETLGTCALEASLETAKRWDLPVRPVVLDAGNMDVAMMVRRFTAAGVPFLARISSSLRLTPTDPMLRGGVDALSANRIMTVAGNRVRPVLWRDYNRDTVTRANLTTTVRVRLPQAVRRDADPGELRLLGMGEDWQCWPAELWLTNLMDAMPPALVRLTKLTGRIERDFRETADQLGMRDFSGRSYVGWHRHVTLASAAHAVSVLASSKQSA